MTPILYSFRRCPYAMRARLALVASGQHVELREIVLRDKPQTFLDTSPSGTVPCLHASDTVIDESLDIMKWALAQNDPMGWLDMPGEGHDWIARSDGPFKSALDRTKYHTRYPDLDPSVQRAQAAAFLTALNQQITTSIFERPTLADFAIFPFVRQFAFIDKAWFDAQDWPQLQAWLNAHLRSDLFAGIMGKYPQWTPTSPTHLFPDQTSLK